MWSSVCAILLALCVVCGATGAEEAEDFASLGYREDTVIENYARDECVGTLVYNHDSSYENAYCWQLEEVAPPYYGAWAEGFDLGPVNVECAVLWFTTPSPYWEPNPIDVYVWDGGVQGPPENVLCLLPDIEDFQMGFWPEIRQNDIEIDCCVSGDFSVGYWTDDSDCFCVIYCPADENGPGGNPWTCIAPGLGYPTGWQHPNVVHPNCVSMGLGATITEDPSPADSQTWGKIKSLYR